MESENVPVGITQDERIMAALAHASIILPFWGLIGSIVIWATQREKSHFAGFQALQVVVYHLALILLGFLGFACYMCSFFGMFLLMPLGVIAAQGTEVSDPVAGLIAVLTGFSPFCILGLLLLAWLAVVIYGLFGAARVLQGHDFRYVLVGRWLEKYLNREAPAA